MNTNKKVQYWTYILIGGSGRSRTGARGVAVRCLSLLATDPTQSNYIISNNMCFLKRKLHFFIQIDIIHAYLDVINIKNI